MPEKLTLTNYLVRRGSVKSLTRIEAEAFGVPYPLVSGWPLKYGSMEITGQMLAELESRIRNAKSSTAEKARRGLNAAQIHADNTDSGDGYQAAILNRAGVPVEVMRLDYATALDALTFMISLIERIGLEQLARKEGKTFSHWLADSLGARRTRKLMNVP